MKFLLWAVGRIDLRRGGSSWEEQVKGLPGSEICDAR